MIAELAIAVKENTPKAATRIELEKLQQVYLNNETKHWATLPIGLDLALYKAKRANAYYVLVLSDSKVVGYLLVVRSSVDTEFMALKGWTVLYSYLDPKMRQLGFMRRVYDMIIARGRLISAPVQTPKGMAMWISRIKTDNRHTYVAVTGKGKVIPVDGHSVDNLKRTVWDGDPKTVLVCAPNQDTKMKNLLAKNKAKQA